MPGHRVRCRCSGPPKVRGDRPRSPRCALGRPVRCLRRPAAARRTTRVPVQGKDVGPVRTEAAGQWPATKLTLHARRDVLRDGGACAGRTGTRVATAAAGSGPGPRDQRLHGPRAADDYRLVGDVPAAPTCVALARLASPTCWCRRPDRGICCRRCSATARSGLDLMGLDFASHTVDEGVDELLRSSAAPDDGCRDGDGFAVRAGLAATCARTAG